jgi:hypothetical protein
MTSRIILVGTLLVLAALTPSLTKADCETNPNGQPNTGKVGCESRDGKWVPLGTPRGDSPPPSQSVQPPVTRPAPSTAPETAEEAAARKARDAQGYRAMCLDATLPIEDAHCNDVRADPAMAETAARARRQREEWSLTARRDEQARREQRATILSALTAADERCRAAVPTGTEPKRADGSIVELAHDSHTINGWQDEWLKPLVSVYASGDFHAAQVEVPTVTAHNQRANHVLGVMLFYGCGGVRDLNKAMFNFNVAGGPGMYGPAAYNAALGYEFGLGVKKNVSRAKYWYGMAERGSCESWMMDKGTCSESVAALDRLGVSPSQRKKYGLHDWESNSDWKLSLR